MTLTATSDTSLLLCPPLNVTDRQSLGGDRTASPHIGIHRTRNHLVVTFGRRDLMQHMLTLLELRPDELKRILQTAAHLKQRLVKNDRPPILERQVLALLFEKPSLRTRVSFEAGMAQLGGSSLFLGEDVGWGTRESRSQISYAYSVSMSMSLCVVPSRMSESSKWLRSTWLP
jgi:hypothetical protein